MEAMQSDLQALEKHNTWDLIILHAGKKALGYK